MFRRGWGRARWRPRRPLALDDDVLDALVGLADGHPQRAMLLAHHLWRESATASSHRAWERALEAAFTELQEPYERLLGSLSRLQRAVLVLAARGARRLQGDAAAAAMGATRSTVRDALERLAELGHLRRRGRAQLDFVDPLLAEYLRGDAPGTPRRPGDR